MSTTNLPIIFLHGYSGEATNLMEFARFHSGDEAICFNLPGFGSTSVSDTAARDFDVYCDEVWKLIRQHVPTGKVILVGHSYGAMITFALGCRYPDDIDSIELYNPVVSPSRTPYMIARTVRLLRRLHIPRQPLIWLSTRPFLVDMVTHFMLRPEWSSEIRQKVQQIRRSEAAHYNKTVFHLMEQSLDFKRSMGKRACTVPVKLCIATDDTVASRDDAEWYETRSRIVSKYYTTGGHLGVLAEPERLAHIFQAKS